MIGLKRMTIEELRKCYIVVYTQEEVDQFSKLGVNAIITYINGAIDIGKKVDNSVIEATLLTTLKSVLSVQQTGNVKLRYTVAELKMYLAD
ncbi:hypothetical protein [Bacteroides oleiciplenus]|uniref:Uncharacterized protein n=1 Tax=Bacteroides oleiciplenus YIT 12058 TaxID=742727 RepID=K9DZA7_9BACE|nr:hypothetical protein [Bacteroides oleiciplenus]EKU90319.1 hypothetical protein HMPREF9447_01737 [Bacteroides oleiciplenus YIT 12058]